MGINPGADDQPDERALHTARLTATKRQYLDGALDDLRIYKRALAASEIQALHIAP